MCVLAALVCIGYAPHTGDPPLAEQRRDGEQLQQLQPSARMATASSSAWAAEVGARVAALERGRLLRRTEAVPAPPPDEPGTARGAPAPRGGGRGRAGGAWGGAGEALTVFS